MCEISHRRKNPSDKPQRRECWAIYNFAGSERENVEQYTTLLAVKEGRDRDKQWSVNGTENLGLRRHDGFSLVIDSLWPALSSLHILGYMRAHNQQHPGLVAASNAKLLTTPSKPPQHFLRLRTWSPRHAPSWWFSSSIFDLDFNYEDMLFIIFACFLLKHLYVIVAIFCGFVHALETFDERALYSRSMDQGGRVYIPRVPWPRLLYLRTKLNESVGVELPLHQSCRRLHFTRVDITCGILMIGFAGISSEMMVREWYD